MGTSYIQWPINLESAELVALMGLTFARNGEFTGVFIALAVLASFTELVQPLELTSII